MKCLSLIALFALTLGCKEHPIDAPVVINQTITAGKQQTVTFSSSENLAITIDDLKDNRCPVNVACIRAGELVLDATATQGTTKVPFSLCTGSDCQLTQKDKPAKTTFTIAGRIWTVELVNTPRTLTSDTKATLNVQIQ
jgi:hypothetical protein